MIPTGDVAMTEWIILEIMAGIRSTETTGHLLERLQLCIASHQYQVFRPCTRHARLCTGIDDYLRIRHDTPLKAMGIIRG